MVVKPRQRWTIYTQMYYYLFINSKIYFHYINSDLPYSKLFIQVVSTNKPFAYIP